MTYRNGQVIGEVQGFGTDVFPLVYNDELLRSKNVIFLGIYKTMPLIGNPKTVILVDDNYLAARKASDIDELALINFLILHELGHHYNGDMVVGEDRRRDSEREKAADRFAMKYSSYGTIVSTIRALTKITKILSVQEGLTEKEREINASSRKELFSRINEMKKYLDSTYHK